MLGGVYDHLVNLIRTDTCQWFQTSNSWAAGDRMVSGTSTDNANGCGRVWRRILLIFRDVNRIPTNIIRTQSARLKLTGARNEPSDPTNWLFNRYDSANDLWIYRVTTSWILDQTNWMNQPNFTTVNAASIPGSTYQFGYDVDIDVTDLVNDILANNRQMRLVDHSSYSFTKCLHMTIVFFDISQYSTRWTISLAVSRHTFSWCNSSKLTLF